MKELTEKQLTMLAFYAGEIHEIYRAQLINAVEQVINGTWSTQCLKQSKAWARIPDGHKAELSHLIDQWLYRAAGNKGVDEPKALTSYYTARCEVSVIMPAKVVI